MRTLRIPLGALALAAVLAGVAVLALSRPDPSAGARAAATLAGRVTSAAEGPMEGVVVTAKREGGTIAVSVVTDAGGRYRFPPGRLEAGRHAMSIRAVGYDLEGPRAIDLGEGGDVAADLRLRPTADLEAQLTNAEWLMSAPGNGCPEAHVRGVCPVPHARPCVPVGIRLRGVARRARGGWTGT